jgi:hypothetical protein
MGWTLRRAREALAVDTDKPPVPPFTLIINHLGAGRMPTNAASLLRIAI